MFYDCACVLQAFKRKLSEFERRHYADDDDDDRLGDLKPQSVTVERIKSDYHTFAFTCIFSHPTVGCSLAYRRKKIYWIQLVGQYNSNPPSSIFSF